MFYFCKRSYLKLILFNCKLSFKYILFKFYFYINNISLFLSQLFFVRIEMPTNLLW